MKQRKPSRKQKEITEAKEKLAELIQTLLKNKKEGRKPVIYTILNHCSKSGMTRSISTKIILDNEPLNLDYYISKITGMKFDDKNGGIKIGGCGMDMGFAMVDDMFGHLMGRYNWQNDFRHEWMA